MVSDKPRAEPVRAWLCQAGRPDKAQTNRASSCLPEAAREAQRPVPWFPSLHHGHARRRCCRSHPALRFTIFDVAFHEKNAAHWVQLPSKLMAREGRSDINEATRKPLSRLVIECEDRETRDTFPAALWQRL
jgi:hypothetical protein